jgi:hypothetical protein
MAVMVFGFFLMTLMLGDSPAGTVESAEEMYEMNLMDNLVSLILSVAGLGSFLSVFFLQKNLFPLGIKATVKKHQEAGHDILERRYQIYALPFLIRNALLEGSALLGVVAFTIYRMGGGPLGANPITLLNIFTIALFVFAWVTNSPTEEGIRSALGLANDA